jgi:hypothetical protein
MSALSTVLPSTLAARVRLVQHRGGVGDPVHELPREQAIDHDTELCRGDARGLQPRVHQRELQGSARGPAVQARRALELGAGGLEGDAARHV